VKWLKPETVSAIHDELIAEHGGPPGLRDGNLLASALARPEHLAGYGKPSVFDLAAAYAHGLAKNHPFVDGNKRTALMACYVFLRLNGYRLEATEADAVATFVALAAGKLTEGKLSAWLKANSTKKR
jgi:death-on-curing protein